MILPDDINNLKYGIIYLYSDRSLPKLHDPEAIVEKFVYPLQVKWIDEPGRNDLLMIARRFNVGSIGQYATVSLTLSRMNRSGGWFEAIRQFAETLMGVSDTSDGNIVLNETDFEGQYQKNSSVFENMCEAAPQDHTRVESKKHSLRNYIKEKLEELLYDDEKTILAPKSAPRPTADEDAVSYSPSLDEPDILQIEENHELDRIEFDREHALERIKRDIVNYIARYHDDPKELFAELLHGKVVVGAPGRLLVNGDMKIVLPEYDEMEIEMPAMCRTLYILFLKQRKLGGEGIVLKNIDEYRDEIFNIYGLVKPGASESRVKKTVNNLCDPFSESLNQMISKINRCIRNVITDKSLAQDYCITGNRGEEYSIALDPQYMELPHAVIDG